MADATVDLITFAIAKLYVGAPDTDEAYIDRFINAASLWLNQYTNRHIVSKAYDGTDDDGLYDGDNSTTLWLKQTPVTAITSISQDSERTFGADTLITATDYVWYRSGKVYNENSRWYRGAKTIKVVYTAGYAVVPEPLVQACLIIVDYLYKSFDKHRFGLGGTSEGEFNISYIHNVPVEAKELAKPYRRVAVG